MQMNKNKNDKTNSKKVGKVNKQMQINNNKSNKIIGKTV